MPIDPNISMSYRGVEVPNPLNQLAQVSQIQAAQRQGEVAQMQLEDLKNDRIEMAAFQRDTGLTTPQAIATLMRNPKTRGQAIELQMKYKQQLQADKFLRDRYPGLPGLFGEEGAAAPAAAPMAAPAAAAQIEPTGAQVGGPIAVPNVMAAPLTAPRNAMVAPAAAPAAAPANALVAPPTQGAASPTGRTRQELEYTIELAKMNPYLAGAGEVAKLELAEMMKTPPDVATMKALGYPLTKAGYAAFRDAQRQERLLSPEEEAQKIRIAHASRQPQQPTAPTITQIVDPTDPNKMITIDARRYQGGGVGSPGVLGVAGKEPSAALRTNKIEEGKTQLQDDLDNLRASFNRLNDMAALPSTQRGTLSNIMSATQGSTVGQMLGRAGGTEAQVERDVISSAKQRLLTAIKNATGMSAQQLNSNMELQAMLRSLSDVSLGYEASMRIIDDIEDAYVKGAGMKKKNAAPPATPPAAGGASGKWEVVR